ncbi:hypothetical protein GV791_07425 [Nocardia cyriacigeorgica]|jgi:DNA-binding transcriptional regulator YhcF (GntR family)|uniref:HTH marR-type domain-containing protein n=2 Tax=Nocardia TaxID=1817 RepID=A0A366CX14_9NOCA|nr:MULTISPECIES: hypothetical protein [Nocardia]AVH20792.1 hypothetical protein C5B73_04205 [Nocardia cyriacigeorgica]MBF6188616.1 hypothetical protein [Nocardia farcinica]MBF6326864.1 hypothetical protein [Nocardia cyriacigeorgica]MBF6540999.1 hypothetical protein [Nocardia farcinica]NEW32390.1 hypothetical protein [Nocardia cyriacigeorgica]
MTTALEKDVFALLQPGGPLTVETIAYDLSVPPWTVARALDALRHNGDVFRNRRAQWQVSADKRRPARQASR